MNSIIPPSTLSTGQSSPGSCTIKTFPSALQFGPRPSRSPSSPLPGPPLSHRILGEPRSGSPHSPSTGLAVSKMHGVVPTPPAVDSVKPNAPIEPTYSPLLKEAKSISTSTQASGVGGETVASDVGGASVGGVLVGGAGVGGGFVGGAGVGGDFVGGAEVGGVSLGASDGDSEGDSEGEDEGEAERVSLGLALGAGLLLGDSLGDSLRLELGGRTLTWTLARRLTGRLTGALTWRWRGHRAWHGSRRFARTE